MRFAPVKSRGGVIGVGLLAALVAVEAGLVWFIASRSPGPGTAVLGLAALVLLPVILRLAFWTWGYFRLAYEVTRDGVVIRWAATEQVIPMLDIVRISSGRPLQGSFTGLRWPGYRVGHAFVTANDERQVPLLLYVTAPDSSQILLWTKSMAYAISPADRKAFVEELKVRRRLGPVQLLAEETRRHVFARLPLWSDRLTLRLVVTAALVNAALFAWVAWRHPALAQELVLQYRFDPEVREFLPNGPNRPRTAIWSLPVIGLLILAVNSLLAGTVHSRSRLGATLLVTGAILTQLAIGLALARIL